MRLKRLEALLDAVFGNIPLRLMIACLIAVGTFFFVELTEDFLFFGRDRADALDRAMVLHADTPGIAADAVPVVIIDFDQASHEKAGRPFFTPRRHLAAILSETGKSGAHVILVDILLESEVDQDGEVRKALEQIAADPGAPPVILARRLTGANRFADSFLEDLVSREPKLFWGSVEALIEEDGHIRRGSFMAAGCEDSASGEAQVLISAPLLASVIARQGLDAALALERSAQRVGARCDGTFDDPRLIRTALEEATGRRFRVSDASVAGRVFFHMRWDLPDRRARTVAAGDGSGRRRPVMTVLPAGRFAEFSGREGVLDSTILDGTVVLIGASHQDTGDWRRTPVGFMPGVAVLANAVRSFDAYGTLMTPSILQQVVVTLVMTLLSFAFLETAIFYRERISRRGGLGRVLRFVTSPVVLKDIWLIALFFVWILLSVILLRQGTWIEILVPQYVATLYLAFSDMWKHVNREKVT